MEKVKQLVNYLNSGRNLIRKEGLLYFVYGNSNALPGCPHGEFMRIEDV